MSTDTSAVIRRYKKNIEISAAALVIIGVWSVLKDFITVMMGVRSLQEILQILPRNRKRSDAYTGLVKYLQSRGVTLTIKSSKPKKV